MFLDEFFYIKDLKVISDSEITAAITLNPEHIIFNGHFPGKPVVPGVMSIQIVNEILAKHLGIYLITTEAKSIKFTSMIIPIKDRRLDVNIAYTSVASEAYKVIADIRSEDTVFMKFNGILTKSDV